MSVSAFYTQIGKLEAEVDELICAADKCADAYGTLRTERDALMHDIAQYVRRDAERETEVAALRAERDEALAMTDEL